jgi:hypothetical protein
MRALPSKKKRHRNIPKSLRGWEKYVHNLMKSIANLEALAKQHLERNVTADFERLQLLKQLVRYGICTCQCHFSTSVYHSAAPCCGNGQLADDMG